MAEKKGGRAARKFDPFAFIQKDLPSGRMPTLENPRHFDSFMSALVLSGNPVMLTSGLPRALNNMYVNRLPKEYLFNAYRSLLGIPYRGKWPGVQKRVELDNEEVVNKVQAFFECGREKALAHMNEGIYDIDMICEYYDVFIKHFLPD